MTEQVTNEQWRNLTLGRAGFLKGSNGVRPIVCRCELLVEIFGEQMMYEWSRECEARCKGKWVKLEDPSWTAARPQKDANLTPTLDPGPHTPPSPPRCPISCLFSFILQMTHLSIFVISLLRIWWIHWNSHIHSTRPQQREQKSSCLAHFFVPLCLSLYSEFPAFPLSFSGQSGEAQSYVSSPGGTGSSSPRLLHLHLHLSPGAANLNLPVLSGVL